MARRKKKKKKCQEDESARSDFVSLYLCKTKAWWIMGKITTLLFEEEEKKMCDRQNLEKTIEFISGWDIVQVKNT